MTSLTCGWTGGTRGAGKAEARGHWLRAPCVLWSPQCGRARGGHPERKAPLVLTCPLLGSPGGLTAVIYTDTLQTVIMVGGALVLMFLGKEEA